MPRRMIGLVTSGGSLSPATVNVTKSITSGINAMGNQSGAVAMDLSKGNVITMTLTGNVTSSTFTNAVASAGQEITFIITQDGTGSWTFVWPTAVVPAGVNPAPSLAPASVTIFKGVVDGSANVNWVINSGITVFRQTVGAITTSDGGHTTVYTPTAIGRYLVTTIVYCTVAGTTATMSVRAVVGQGNQSNLSSNAALSSGTFGNCGITVGVFVTAANAANQIGWATTLTNVIGTAVFAVDLIIQYLGN